MQAAYHPMPTSRNLGWMLQSVRKSRRMTQGDLASRVGVSQSRISHLEKYPDELSLQQLLAWCSALGLELAIGPKGRVDKEGTAAEPAAW